MNRTSFVLILFLLIASSAFSDDVFFLTKPGATQLIASLNANGKAEAFSLMTIKEVKENGNDLTVVYAIQVLDKNKKIIDKAGQREYSIKFSGGVMELEIKNTMDAFFAARGMNYSITGDKLFIPSNITVGSKLNDTWMKMIIKIPIIGDVIADIVISDVVCTGIETVTVPAGTFEAYKVTQITTTVTKGWPTPKIINTGATWYAKGIGMVKSVNYDEKGRIESSSELYEMVN